MAVVKGSVATVLPSPVAVSPPVVSRRTVLNIPILLDRLCYRSPSLLVDAITEHDAGRRLVAVKNVTVNEDFFQGHFPGAPLMPGGADARIDVAGRGDSAAAARGCAAQRPRLPARRQRREVPPPGRAGRSAAARGHARRPACQRWRAPTPRRLSAISWSPKRSCCSASSPTKPTSTRRRSSIRAPSSGRARRSGRTSRSALTCASAPTAASAPASSSTATPPSATTAKSIRSPRSAWCRRTSSSRASETA